MLVGSVEEALSRGAKGVSVQVNMGSPAEPEMIERLGLITQDSHYLDCPVLGMIYPRGKYLNVMEEDETDGAAHAARLAFELGCQVVKTKWTGSIESFKKVTSAVPIPVLIAGGPAGSSTKEILTIVEQAMQAGAGGVCMGRQVFSHSNPKGMVSALKAIIHDRANVEQAMEEFGL
jgi:DhnA family fructose-bisphosphate aldolase class Ia